MFKTKLKEEIIHLKQLYIHMAIKVGKHKRRSLFCFSFNKRSPELFGYLISWKWSTNQQKQYYRIQNKSICQKLDHPAKTENRPKKRYMPFLHESLQLNKLWDNRKQNATERKNIVFFTYGSQRETLGFGVLWYWTIFLVAFQ